MRRRKSFVIKLSHVLQEKMNLHDGDTLVFHPHPQFPDRIILQKTH